MRWLTALLAVALLAVPGTAMAAGKGAHVYRAKLAPVAADATTPTGRAHLVDGKKNNILTIHAKGLTAGVAYPWHMHAFDPSATPDPCAPGATPGPVVPDFAYPALTANPAGNAHAKAKSGSFDWGPATNGYYVDIHDPVTDAPIACGVLDRKASKAQPQGSAPQRQGKGPQKPQPQGKLRGFERH
jgi:hypothetical protein